MPNFEQKPIVHGRDHRPGGVDPIPGLDGGGGHVIEDEGTPLMARTNLNFVGAGVVASDDAGGDASQITIPGGAVYGGAFNRHRIGTTENRWYTPQLTGATMVSQAYAANRLKALPFVPSKDMTINGIGISPNGTASGNVRCGIYTDDGNNYPAALVAQSVQISTNVSNVSVDTTISAALTAGELYWLATAQSGAATMRGPAGTECIPLLGYETSGGGTFLTPATGWDVAFTYASLPSTFPGSASPVTGTIHSVFIRGS